MGTKPCTPHGVLARLTELFVRHGPPSYRRSDNGPEFTATAMRSWLRQLGVTTLAAAPILIEHGRPASHPVRPPSALGSRPPAPEAVAIEPPHPTPAIDRRVLALTYALVQPSRAGHRRRLKHGWRNPLILMRC